MKLTRSTCYALYLLRELARVDGAYLAAVKAAAQAQVPAALAHKIMHRLIVGGLVVGTRGTGCGCRLVKPAAEMTLLDVLYATGDEVEVTTESSLSTAALDAQVDVVLYDAAAERRQWLRGVSLADLFQEES